MICNCVEIFQQHHFTFDDFELNEIMKKKLSNIIFNIFSALTKLIPFK